MKNILIVATDGMEDMEIAPLIEIPGWTKVVEDVEKVNVKIAGWDDVIHLFHGTKIVPDLKMDEVKVDDYDAIVIPGGWPGTKFFEYTFTEKFKAFLIEAEKKNKLIVTLCFGVFPVGNAGLLKGRKATSFAGDCCDMCRQVKGQVVGMGADFVETAVIYDKNLISDIGPAVADEVALQMMEKLIGADDVKKIVDMMMYTRVSPKELKWTGPVVQNAQKK
jgi:4-methyl-5(b-hydroxyethyl)-thiazole monophosphate biosynthesis